MNIKDLNGRIFKKALNARQCVFRYHNKNKSGGNFAFEIRDVLGRDFEIGGHYNQLGEIKHLDLSSRIYWPGATVDPYHYETKERIIALILSICGDVKEP